MVDSEHSLGDYKPSKISIKEVMKNPEMLKFVPDHLKTKQIGNHAVKKLRFVIRYVPDQFKTKKPVIKLF